MSVDNKSVVFQSRYRSYHVVLQQKVLARDEKGHGVFEDITAQFENFMLVLADNEENAEKIALLRKKQGSDFVEVDVQKKQAQHKANQDELTALKSRVKELEAQVKASPAVVTVAPPKDTPVVAPVATAPVRLVPKQKEK